MAKISTSMETALLKPEMRTCAFCHQPVQNQFGRLVLDTDKGATFYHTICARKIDRALYDIDSEIHRMEDQHGNPQ